MCVFIFSVASTWNILGAFLKVGRWFTLLLLDLVLYLCVLVLYTMVSFFGVLSTFGITWFWASGVSAFIFSISFFGNFIFLGVTADFSWLDFVFDGWTCWSSYGYASTIGNLGDSALVMDFIGMRFSFGFLLGSPVGVFLGMPPWLATSEILLGRFIFQIFSLGISMLPCVHLIVLLVGLLVLDSVVHKLNTVRHELLHPWRTLLECWVVQGETIMCLIFSPLLFWYVWIMAFIVFHFWSYVLLYP